MSICILQTGNDYFTYTNTTRGETSLGPGQLPNGAHRHLLRVQGVRATGPDGKDRAILDARYGQVWTKNISFASAIIMIISGYCLAPYFSRHQWPDIGQPL